MSANKEKSESCDHRSWRSSHQQNADWYTNKMRCLHDHELSKHMTHITKLLTRIETNYTCLGTAHLRGALVKRKNANKRIWPKLCPKRGSRKVGIKSHSFRRGGSKKSQFNCFLLKLLISPFFWGGRGSIWKKNIGEFRRNEPRNEPRNAEPGTWQVRWPKTPEEWPKQRRRWWPGDALSEGTPWGPMGPGLVGFRRISGMGDIWWFPQWYYGYPAW